ncbi:Nefh [Symbiodinium natans]|uniref:Nefh protein n=1 Tax=Symbiodinium natans TaxID=878477 RepID=A0A812RVI9_9DINO|nr:Nefh [Symbiodinium natans]
MVDACEDEQTALLRKYVLSRKGELEQFADAEDSAFGPHSVSPFVPCAPGRIPYVLQAARLGPEDVLWDLGCGDGVVLIEAARRCGCRCVGLDIDGPCIATARQRAREANVEERCKWLRCDMLQLPQGTLSAHCHENEELRDLPAATCALVFLTAHGLVRLSKWLHEEWREGSSRQLRLVTCVESLDSAVDFNEPDALFANANELEWPVCRDLERWGVFVVPPFGQDVSTWSESLPPLQLTRAEAEATQAAALSNVLTEEQVDLLDALGSKLLESEDETTDSIDLFAHSEVSFHKAAEAALHRLGQHRVLYLHSDEATAQLSSDERTFLQTLEETVSARIRSEDASRWGLLGRRAVALRSMEYHAYGDGGSVMDPEHRDDGSLLTVSILLSRKDNFEGGIFSTFVGSQRVELAMGTGDGVLFVSEKRHNVSPVIGDRRTLVLEFWEGMRNHHGRHD